MVYHSWCTNGIDGFADLGSIQLHSLDQLDFQKQEAWIYRSFPCGIFSSPCSTPVLIALLAIVAGEGNLIWGILLMLLYSIGHSALVMVAGTSIGFVQKINNSEKYKKAAVILKIVMGAAILLIGFYMFWLAF